MPTVEHAKRSLEEAIHQRDERIVKLVAAGMSYAYVAHAEGITRARVEQIIKRGREAQKGAE